MKTVRTQFGSLALAGLMGLGGLMGTLYSAAGSAADPMPQLRMTAAEHVSAALGTKVLAATRAGKRIVAVGDHGAVLLSDDDGKTFRQAQSVPVSSTLTAVTFIDTNTGWAVGHWGAVVKTTDGGEHWALQSSDMAVDQPLFSVYFRSAGDGWAVGLWSLILHTTDGGANWSTVSLTPPGTKKSDRNLYSIFADQHNDLFIACEQGRVARSSDDGATWSIVDTGYAGSFWTGLALQDGTLLVGGLRGTVYRSADGGRSWQPSKTQFRSSVTGLAQSSKHSVEAVGLDGVSLVSSDDGISFAGKQRPDRTALTAVTFASDGKPVLFSVNGPVRP